MCKWQGKIPLDKRKVWRTRYEVNDIDNQSERTFQRSAYIDISCMLLSVRMCDVCPMCVQIKLFETYFQ